MASDLIHLSGQMHKKLPTKAATRSKNKHRCCALRAVSVFVIIIKMQFQLMRFGNRRTMNGQWQVYNASEISSRFWNQSQKGTEESLRESTFIDDIIQKSHIERCIHENLSSVQTVFDGGAGSGRFSIMLAKAGINVTHFDISLSMIDEARRQAENQRVIDKITFIHGKLEDLSAYANRQFDMVLSIDAPISYTYPNQYDVIKNLIQIANKKIVISVASNLGWIPYMFNPAQKAQYILNKDSDDSFVKWTLNEAVKKVSSFKPDMEYINKVYKSHMMTQLEDMLDAHQNGETQWPHTYAFMPDELKKVMETHGAKNIKLSGPGALSRSIPNEILKNIMLDDVLRKDFLSFCYEYDSNASCAGMGKDNLVASADV